MLWDYDSYGRLPRHVRSLDVGVFTSDGTLMSVAEGREYFVLNEWSEGEEYRQGSRTPFKERDRRVPWIHVEPSLWPAISPLSIV